MDTDLRSRGIASTAQSPNTHSSLPSGTELEYTGRLAGKASQTGPPEH